MKNQEYLIYFLLIFMILFSSVFFSCSYTVPLSRSTSIDNPPAQKISKSVLIVMSAEEAQRIIEYSPQIGDTYVFEAGESLKELLIDVFGQLYTSVAYIESIEQAPENYDIAIEPRLTNNEIVISIRKGNSVKLEIEYSVYDLQGNTNDVIITETSSTEKYTTGEKVVTYVIRPLFFNIGKNKDKIGQAWDTAMLNSITQLLNWLAKTE